MKVSINKGRNHWPLFLAVIGIVFLALTCWSVLRAGTRGGEVVDRDYYQHGLRYGQGAEEAGWQVKTTLDRRVLRITVTDRGSRPVAGCLAELRLVAAGKTLPMQETTDGIYETELPQRETDTAALLTLRRADAMLARRLLLTSGGRGDGRSQS